MNVTSTILVNGDRKLSLLSKIVQKTSFSPILVSGRKSLKSVIPPMFFSFNFTAIVDVGNFKWSFHSPCIRNWILYFSLLIIIVPFLQRLYFWSILSLYLSTLSLSALTILFKYLLYSFEFTFITISSGISLDKYSKLPVEILPSKLGINNT